MDCAICKRNRKQRWEEQNPDSRLQSSLNQLGIGVTVEWYRAKEQEQGGVCAICGKPETETRNGKIKRLSVDHDHATGEPRALLCNRCNKDLGIIETLNPEWKVKAEAYLVQHEACFATKPCNANDSLLITQ